MRPNSHACSKEVSTQLDKTSRANAAVLPLVRCCTALGTLLYRPWYATVPPLVRRCTALGTPLYRPWYAAVPPLVRCCTALGTQHVHRRHKAHWYESVKLSRHIRTGFKTFKFQEANSPT